MKIERREFLKLFGGSAGAVLLAGFGLDQILEVPEPVIERLRNGPGIETWKRTICGMCPGGCGLQVRLVDDVPVYVKGNPDYPVNFGGMCPLGHASLETLFNPDRLQGPMRRVGPPGAGRFEPTTWPEAMEHVALRLGDLRAAGRAHEVAFLAWPAGRHTEDTVRRFMHAYGSPNVFINPDLAQFGVPYLLAEGRSDPPAYDLLNTRTILSLGSDFLEGEFSPVHYTKIFVHEPEGTLKTLIHASPRMGLTGAKAHRWLPVRPGTYGALALGIAHVLLREELYDAAFVRNHTFGFEDWTDENGVGHRGFRTIVLSEYFPERVSRDTGIRSETIIEVARTVGIETPSVVLGGSGVAADSSGTFGQMAVHGLNALLGNFYGRGGIVRTEPTPLLSLPEPEVDDAAAAGLAHPSVGRRGPFPVSGFSIDAFTQNLLEGDPYPISLLFVLGGNPVFESIRHHDLVEALRRIPLIVSFDSFRNETSEFADFILPDHTFLEQWELTTSVPSVGAAHVGVRQPVIEPLFDTRQAAVVVAQLADAIGPSVGASVQPHDPEAAVRSKVQGLYDAGTGALATESVHEHWLDYLQQRGWHMGQYNSFRSFWDELLRYGGWWNPQQSGVPQPGFDTPSGRFEFQSRRLAELLEDAGGSIADDLLPALEEIGLSASTPGGVTDRPDRSDDENDLHLVIFGTNAVRDGVGANLPLMQELFGMTARRPWRTWAEIHPDVAESHGLADGDWIRLETSIGSIRVQTRVVPTIAAHSVGVPLGQGHTSYGRYARGVGVNPHAIVRARYDPLSGRPATLSTRVRITRIA